MSDPATKLRNRLKALQAAIEGERRNMDGAHVTKTDKIFADCIALAGALEAPPVSGLSKEAKNKAIEAVEGVIELWRDELIGEGYDTSHNFNIATESLDTLRKE